jgi:hypothetical protein
MGPELNFEILEEICLIEIDVLTDSQLAGVNAPESQRCDLSYLEFNCSR